MTLSLIYHSYQGSRAVEEKAVVGRGDGMSAPSRPMRIVLLAALLEIRSAGAILALVKGVYQHAGTKY